MSIIFAGVEGGGTSFVLTVASYELSPSANNVVPHTPFKILHQINIPSSSPSKTLIESAEFFQKHYPKEGYSALGIATFGPVGVNPNRPLTYGRILPGSPKRDWRNVDILAPILHACSSEDGKKVPLYRVDTDVNAPAMAEFMFHTKSSKEVMMTNNDITSLAYVTVGTGIGVGLVINSKPVHGMMHPEGGHVPIVPLTGDDFGYSWGQKSPFGGRNTVEGTACSVALTERVAASKEETNSNIQNDSGAVVKDREELKNLPDDHALWDHAANSLANLCCTLILVTSIEKIVLGGGVMNRAILFEKIRIRTRELLNGYLDLQQVTTDAGLKDLIGPSVWSETTGGVGPGLVGSLVLAQTAYEESIKS